MCCDYLLRNPLERLFIASIDGDFTPVTTVRANFIEETVICHCAETKKAAVFELSGLAEDVSRGFPESSFP